MCSAEESEGTSWCSGNIEEGIHLLLQKKETKTDDEMVLLTMPWLVLVFLLSKDKAVGVVRDCI